MTDARGLLHRHRIILQLVFLAAVFSLALLKIHDTDSWTHLSFGKWIWEHRAIPSLEPFIQTGQPYPYQNWLFGFVFYIAYLAGGASGVVIFKAVIVAAAWYIMFRDSLRPHRDYLLSAAIMTAFAILIRFRYVERPDIFLMVFLPFSVFALNAYVNDNKKYIYALPLVHLLWANSHTSIPLMAVPFAAFLAGGFLQQYAGGKGIQFSGTPGPRQLKGILAVGAVSFLASLISPYGLGQYLHSVSAVQSDWWKQEIAELLKPTWDSFKPPYIVTAAFVVSAVWTRFGTKDARSALRSLRHSPQAGRGRSRLPSLIPVLLVIPFIYLSFTAKRFAVPLVLVAAPIIVRDLASLFGDRDRSSRFLENRAGFAAALGGLVLATVLACGNMLKLDEKEFPFGCGVELSGVPEGALAYMDANGITGKVYNVFHWGGYMTWRDFPKRVPFVDGRGFLSSELLERLITANRSTQEMDELHKRYGFESILIGYPADIGKISGLSYHIDRTLSHPGWALVYWDDLSLLYLRRGGPYDAIIKKDEYRFVKPGNVITAALPLLQDPASRVGFVRELKRNADLTGSTRAYVYTGYVLNETGLYREAIEAFSHVRNTQTVNFLPVAYSGTAYAYGKLGSSGEALEYYKRSLDLMEDATLYYKIGLIHLEQGDAEKAASFFAKAIRLNPSLQSVYPLLISTYRSLGLQTRADEVAAKQARMKRHGEGEEHFNRGVAEYFAKNYQTAEMELRRSIEVNPENPVAWSNLGYIYYDIGSRDKAFECQRKAIDIDPNYANAHYGLALIYSKQGNLQMAKASWREYLRIEPSGYFSRRAKQQIETIK